MYSQKNVLQVFVSPLSGPKVTASTALAALAAGEIGFFSKDTNETAASGLGYFGFNDGGFIKKSNVVDFAGWDVKAFAAATPHTETILPPAPTVAGTFYTVSVNVKTDNNNGDKVYKGFYKSKDSDTATIVGAALAGSLQNAIDREGGLPEFTVSVATGTLTITAAPLPYKVGRQQGGYSKFQSSLSHPAETAFMGTVTVDGTPGIGTGQYIHTKEFFYKQNHDAVSINDFRTALPKTLNSVPTGEYDVQAAHTKLETKEASDNVKALPRQVLIAFDTAGAAPSA